MAYTYSAVQRNSSYGNCVMDIKIYRGACIRTETFVSFSFGVCFTPIDYNITNSIAAWYGGKQKFAYTNTGYSYENAPVRANKNTNYHAKFDDRNSTRSNTSETLCYSYTNNSISANTNTITVSVGVGWADFAGTKKGTLSFSLPIPEYHGDIGTGTTTIKDNLNNSFTITATKGANGTNNTAYGPINLKWGYDSSSNKSNTYTNNQTIALARNNPASPTRTVYAESTTTSAYSSAKTATAGTEIKQYYDPEDPGVPALTEGSFKNGRLTVKQPWTYLWTRATKRGYSDVRGYRIRVKKNGSFIKGLVYYANGNLTLGTGTNEFVDTENKNNSVTFDPEKLGFKAGDTVQLRIHAYTRNGLGQLEWIVGSSTYRLFSAAKDSPVTTVQNAGVVNIKTTEGWKEGQVYVKIGSTWTEAETVYVKTSNGWEESE